MKPSNPFRPSPAGQAAIYSTTAHPSPRSSVPLRLDDREADSTSSPSPMSERLAFTVDEAAYLLNMSRRLACELVEWRAPRYPTRAANRHPPGGPGGAARSCHLLTSRYLSPTEFSGRIPLGLGRRAFGDTRRNAC